jgi:hypothetical protein
MIRLSNADPLHLGEPILVDAESVVVVYDDHTHPNSRLVQFDYGGSLYVKETVEEIGVMLNGTKTISERS